MHLHGNHLSRLALFTCAMLVAANAAASELCVPNVAIDPSCDSAHATINDAIAAAAHGDTVIVGAGDYVEFVEVNKNITLRSIAGRGGTTIRPPVTPTTRLGTVTVKPGSNGVKIGTPGKGFTIEGIDNASPGVESAALYFQGAHTNVEVRDNEIIAAGDGALTTEFGTAITNFLIDGNTFSGKTYVGVPAGDGFGSQFVTPNVPRQVVVMGDGAGAAAGASSNITFTNNLITATAGGLNALGAEQGNNLVTIDSANSTISGNTFQGVTTRFGVSFRSRRPNVTITGNTFDSTGLVSGVLKTPATAHVAVENGASTATVYANNTFDRAAYQADPPVTNGNVGVGPGAIAAVATPGATIEIQNAVYRDQVRVTASNVTINGNGATLRPLQASLVTDVAQGSPCSNDAGTAIVLVSGATGVTIDDLNVDGSLITSMPTRLMGIYYRNASGRIEGGSVVEIRNKPLNGAQNGNAIYIQGQGATTADVDVVGVTVSGYQKNGVTFNGCGCATDVDGIGTGSLIGSTITGAGDTPLIAQNGVQVGFGGSGVHIAGNTISGHRYTGNPNAGVAAGVLIFSATDNVIENNTILNGNNGVVMQGGGFGLCSPADSTGNVVSCNRIEGHNQLAYEIGVSSDAAANTITSNAFANNTVAVDGSAITSGTLDAENNFWGAGDGPSGEGPGSGDVVTENVDFDPFLTGVPACVECSSDAQCDDGLACTGTETCDLDTGTCQSGTPVSCLGECLTGVCNEPTGTCQLEADGSVCNGTPDACSISDTCQAGVCTEGGSGDPDADGVCSADDNCPAVANPTQADLDGDSLGDACDDDDAVLNPTRARIRRNTSKNPARPNGMIKVTGDMIVNLPAGDSLESTDGYGARVTESLGLDTDALVPVPAWPAASCVVKKHPSNVIRTINCKSADKNSTLTIRAVNPISPLVAQVYKFTIQVRRVAINGPFDEPVHTTLRQGAIDRVGTINACQSNQAGMSCKEG